MKEQRLDQETFANFTEEQYQELGEKIADLLHISKIKTGDQKGRYKTKDGTKTAIGLGKTIATLIEAIK